MPRSTPSNSSIAAALMAAVVAHPVWNNALTQAALKIQDLQEDNDLPDDFQEGVMDDLRGILLHGWTCWSLDAHVLAAFEICYHFLSSLLEQSAPGDMCLLVQKMPAREASWPVGWLPKGWSVDLLNTCAEVAQVFEDMELGPVPAELDFWLIKQTLLLAFCSANPRAHDAVRPCRD